MNIIKVTAEEKRRARAAGFRKKKPKKPKSKTERSLTNYISKYNAWAKELKEKAKEGKKLEDLKSKVASV